ncbi:MAG: hypothetical protein F2786_02090 [Actinobacteria bacterium]|uniref:Unannotated protein n=1 Tax=freshwater metagenome TaxID=449393 RepID=A0A6J7CXF1_9ZZZZ|nr:hypothetical protein [Actinomycetota bacterium]
MKRSLIISFIMLFSLPTSAIAVCALPVCVDVYTQDNQIIIEAQKPGTSQVKKPPRPKPSPTATLWFPPKPSPSPHPYVKRTYKPRIVKPKTATQTANLSDRLTKLVPTGGIAFQPALEPLVQVPVIFWVDVPQIFQSRVNIIGEIVDVGLRPGFIWSFGDGSVWATTNIGAPYPHQVITHTYRKPGTYAVVLLTTWNGSFTHNGAVRAITGQIVKTSVATVTVVSAPTHFTK